MNESKTTETFGTGAIVLPKFTITNSFVFPLVMSHKEIAKPFIEAALGIKIYDLKDPEQEKTEQVGIFSKSMQNECCKIMFA